MRQGVRGVRELVAHPRRAPPLRSPTGLRSPRTGSTALGLNSGPSGSDCHIVGRRTEAGVGGGADGRRLGLVPCAWLVRFSHLVIWYLAAQRLKVPSPGSHGQWQLVERGAVVTVVPDGAISGRDWGPGSGRAPPGHQKLAKRGPRRGLRSEHRGVKDVKGVRLGEGRSLRGPCASVYLSNRWTDAPFPQSVRAPPRCPRHGTTA